jgi:hypothetical protein
MDECVKALEEPSVAVKSDIFICQWVRSQQIVEEVGRHFMNEPSANVDISDLSVQYILRGYEQQFDRWKAQIPPEILRRKCLISKSLWTCDLTKLCLIELQLSFKARPA